MTLKALLFDVDGTLADTEEAHRIAFNAAFRDFGYDWHWDRELYTYLLGTTGGKARIRRFLSEQHAGMLEDSGADKLIADLHVCKTEHYVNALNSGGVPLRSGVERLLREAREEGLRLAIATTTSPVNVQALLENTIGKESLDWFEAVGAGDCVEDLKPAPDVYLWVLDKMNLPPEECLAFEDSANGLKAACTACIPTIVTSCPYTRNHDFSGACVILDGLGEPDEPFSIKQGNPHGQTYVDTSLLRHWLEGA